MFDVTRTIVGTFALSTTIACSSSLFEAPPPARAQMLDGLDGTAPVFVTSYHYLPCDMPAFADLHPDMPGRDWTGGGFQIDSVDDSLTDPRFKDYKDRIVFGWPEIYGEMRPTADQPDAELAEQIPPRGGKWIAATTWAGTQEITCGGKSVANAISVKLSIDPRIIRSIEPPVTDLEFFSAWEKQADTLRPFDDFDESYECPEGKCGVQAGVPVSVEDPTKK